MNNKTHEQSYQEEVAQYTKKDGIHALIYAGYTAVILFLFFVIVDGVGSDLFRVDGQLTFVAQLSGIVISLTTLLPLFVILKKKGQSLRSVGLTLIDWKKSLIGGLIFVVGIILLTTVIPGLLMGWQLNHPSRILWLIVYLLIMAVWEDIVYIGYIQTRIYGLVKKDFWAIALGGFIFAVVHYPNLFFRYFADGATFDLSLPLYFLFMTSSWIMMHVLFNHNFRYFRSIITVTLLHFASNLAFRQELWAYTGDSEPNEFIIRGVTIFMMFWVPVFFTWWEKRKATDENETK